MTDLSASLPKPGRKLNISLWVLQAVLAAAFLAAGGSKLAGVPQMVALFEQIGVGQWFRYVTGLIEVVGAVGLLIPRTTFYAAAILTLTMAGAFATHVMKIGGSPVPALVLAALCAVVVKLRWPRR